MRCGGCGKYMEGCDCDLGLEYPRDAVRWAYCAGLSRGLELAKEHARARANLGHADGPIDWSAADEAVAKEGK